MSPLSNRLSLALLWCSVAIVLLTIAVPLYKDAKHPEPRAEGGVLDLRSWVPEHSKTIRLDGEWEFYWNSLLTPQDLAATAPAPERISVPSSWDTIKHDGKSLPDSGYATYRLHIDMPAGHEGIYGIKTSNIRASNRIYVNGELVGSSGDPSSSPDRIVHRNTPYTAFFEVREPRIDIVVQVASYKSFNSGIVQSISLGSQHAISSFNNYNNALDGGLAAGFFVMAIYFIGIFFQRSSYKELLFFALSCLATTAFILTHSERLLTQMFPELSIEAQLYIEDISSILMFSFFSRYVYHSFPHLYPRAVLYVVETLAAIGIVVVLFTSASYNGPFVLSLSFLILFVMLVNSFFMGVAARRDPYGSAYLYIGIIGTLDFVVVNMLNNVWKLEEHYFFPVALPIIVMSQALYVSKQYTRAFETVQELSAKLSTLDKMKDEFLAKTSHELKSPLNAMINISQSLLRGAGGEMSPAHSGDLKLVVDTGKRLSTLVNDILDYSKIKNHDLTLHLKHFDCRMVADAVVEVFAHVIRGKKLTIENRLPRGKLIVCADENRLMQIVYNLVDNAVKYTPSGTIAITGRQSGESVFLTVEDTGIGIPENRFGDIFKSFEQVDSGIARSYGGIGLGLAITQQLVELHGGTVEVSSEVGKGSRFTFSVRAGERSSVGREERERSSPGARYADFASVPSGAALQELAATSEGSGYSILAVDDEYSSLRALTNLLRLDRYEVTAVSGGEEALALLNEGRTYDLVLLDLMMPGMSGYETCKRIRESYSLLELPILMVSAKNQYSDMAAGFLAGANDFLEKPYDHLELRSRVGTLVQLKKSAEELLRKELSFLQAQIKPHFIFNTLNTILSFSYTDHDRSRKLLADFSFYLRNSFDFKEASAFIPLKREMELLRAYLGIEQARFGDMLAVELTIDPAAENVPIPSVLLQPLAENAIYHGIMKKEQGGRLAVRAAVEGDELVVEVRDDGVGMEEKASREAEGGRQGIALENIRSRLMRTYNRDLHIRSAKGEGTVVIVRIPVYFSRGKSYAGG
ncbi:hybrid sensor histidine kinase/response regulator [Cohnella fermenti]|uniref:Circadian input-output histidine kinase CikA n=1 Tax=Cohnella fermenti TaxID=2565925 RepID=A0A4S4C6X9_9BACL|nr:ATP-binding protein [Cohnella fermenti]THF83687.1 response regulator [Cohnella fermenti]